ncbi:MAG: hypothetical protein FD180_3744 [Planctomycetota bacterium]|nr:MAG: hypothetical protein FD180_3744 [Planctomycetota bacterium]
MEINRVDPSFPIRPVRVLELAPPASFDDAPRDVVSISPQARLREQLRAAPDIRTDRVADLRRRIQNGSYDESAALGDTVKRLLGEIE